MTIHSLKRLCRIAYRLSVFCSIAGFLLYGCSALSPPVVPPGYPKPYRMGRTWYTPLPRAGGFRQYGKASWYGKEFHGKRTANGEIYNMYDMTAAHKTLPFDTYVRVHNLDNNKTAMVRINDRGPFARGRIIDLSYSAAKQLGIVGPGTTDVEIDALPGPGEKYAANKDTTSYPISDLYQGNFTVQIGAFGAWKNAEKLRKELARTYRNVYITSYYDGRDTYYRVKVGQYSNLAQANRFESMMIHDGYKDAFAVAEDNPPKK
jgi:rare lipoprotein A